MSPPPETRTPARLGAFSIHERNAMTVRNLAVSASHAASLWTDAPKPDCPATYPLATPATADPRFSPGLVHAVADLLQDNGFPLIHDGGDLQSLAGALFAFLYQPTGVTGR
jgi:hypothetical protein